MERILVIYDATGKIYTSLSGNVQEPQGIPSIWVEIPAGKQIVSVDVTSTPHQPIFEDLPPSETDVLKQRIELLEDTITELILGV